MKSSKYLELKPNKRKQAQLMNYPPSNKNNEINQETHVC